MEEIPFILLLVGVSFATGLFSFVAGRRSARPRS
jgi:hypothetical protein